VRFRFISLSIDTKHNQSQSRETLLLTSEQLQMAFQSWGIILQWLYCKSNEESA